MYPYIEIGNINLSMYSIMMVIGIIVGFFLAYIIVYKKENLSPLTGIRLLVCSMVGFIFMGIGAFFFNSLFHSIEEKKLIFGGITWLGGVVVSFPITIYLIHKFIPSLRGRALYTFSLLLPFIVIAHGFGRIGCFFAGCCYGIESNSFLAVKFPFLLNPVLPTQLFEAAFEFILFAVLMIFRKKLKGKELVIYCFSYGIFRFVLEFFRGDSRGATGILLSPAQLLNIVLILSGVLIVLFSSGKIFKKLYNKCLYWQKNSRSAKDQLKLIYIQTPTECIEELYNLMQKNIITEDEYENKKQKLLKKI